ncbi:hypothetical protein FRC02_009993 [Tulasnella sp. 418]|nr:hypothetical protein FRC02_009993 [Tulasnella sp. 418]
MRISIPTIPPSLLSAVGQSGNKSFPSEADVNAAVQKISSFLAGSRNTLILTGAGVSVDSGIRAYRGKDGRYMNPNYKPIFYQDLVDPGPKGHLFRQRYWARSYLGYPHVRDSLPNPTHFSIVALQYLNIVSSVITQNVDGLHLKALEMGSLDQADFKEKILELHGTLHTVHCRHGHKIDRAAFQTMLSECNPQWKAYADELEQTSTQHRTNPDGDVDLRGVKFDDFVVPPCERCLAEGRNESILKPDVVFFGESIANHVKTRSFDMVETCDRLLVVGTTLATYSAFRLLKHAMELHKPVLMLNVGPTRADTISSLEKIDIQSGSVLPSVCRTLSTSGDTTLTRLLSIGIVQPPAEDDNGDAPVVANR